MGDLISRKETIDDIDNVDWYHPDSNGRMVLGASDQGEAWFRANDIYDVIEELPSAELVNTCDGCIHSGKIDKDYPCRVCIRREKDYYAPER